METTVIFPKPSFRCPSSLYDLLAFQAESRPDHPAFLAPGRSPLSYQQLFDHVTTTVRMLNRLGLGRNDRIALALPNSPEAATTFLAIAAGATCAPLNPAYREQEFDFYLADLKARALVVPAHSDSPAVAVAQARQIPLLELLPHEETGGLFSLRGSTALPAVEDGFAQPDDVALILHTSGTTARPKIVPLTQTNICTSAYNMAMAHELTAADRCLNSMPLFHVHGLISASLASLVAGSSVVCPPPFDPQTFFEWLALFAPTWYTATPTMHQALLASAHQRADTLVPHPLRFVRSSSSALPPQVMTALEETFKAPVIEYYGMTEAASPITCNPLPPQERKLGSAGVPVRVELAILDEQGHFAAAGAIGEVVIRGANVMDGYENNPEANQSAFVDGWFRTGDQGYLDSDGYLFLTGRLKEIINRGGEKISPREVDEVLLEHPAVAQAVTFAIPHPTLGQDVATAVVLRPATEVSEQEIRAFAFTRLIDFKVPSQVIIVDRIPTGPTGKPQRIGLAEKLAEYLQPTYLAPRTPVESILASIEAELLQLPQVGVNDNFFYLGGDSLLALQIVARVSKIFQISLPLSALFTEPTIAELARVVEQLVEADIHQMSEEEAEHLAN